MNDTEEWKTGYRKRSSFSRIVHDKKKRERNLNSVKSQISKYLK